MHLGSLPDCNPNGLLCSSQCNHCSPRKPHWPGLHFLHVSWHAGLPNSRQNGPVNSAQGILRCLALKAPNNSTSFHRPAQKAQKPHDRMGTAVTPLLIPITLLTVSEGLLHGQLGEMAQGQHACGTRITPEFRFPAPGKKSGLGACTCDSSIK